MGDPVIVPPATKTEDIKTAVETIDLPSKKSYLRFTSVPADFAAGGSA